MKKTLILLLFCLFAIALPSVAGITGTNILGLATYAAGTNTSLTYSPPQTHQITPQSFTVYHSATNGFFPTTNYFETTFDGGATWTVTAIFVTGTNSQTETWSPSTTSITASNRVRVISTTNQTLFITPNWIQ